MNAKISIIVPIYNAEKVIEKCVVSILNQEYQNIELLLINDGSTDNTRKIIEDFSKNDSRVLAINTENCGVSTARNLGINKASGYYISFVDADDYIDKNFFTDMVNKIEQDNSDMVMCNFKYVVNKITRENTIDIDKLIIVEQVNKYCLVLSEHSFEGFVWNKLYTRKVIGENRFNVNITFLEDLLFNVCILNNNPKVSIINKSLYNYVISDKSVVNKFEEKHLTYFDSLILIKDIIGEELIPDIDLRYAISLLDFGGKTQFKHLKIYNSLKKDFHSKKNSFKGLKSNSTIKTIILKTSFISFDLGSFLYRKLIQLSRTKLYTKIRE